tara:strand:+ start:994 stop:1167 length:174 start_codon:yes stop_codon:yes gene_type:complete
MTCAWPHALLKIPSFCTLSELNMLIIKQAIHAKVAKGIEIKKMREKYILYSIFIVLR